MHPAQGVKHEDLWGPPGVEADRHPLMVQLQRPTHSVGVRKPFDVFLGGAPLWEDTHQFHWSFRSRPFVVERVEEIRVVLADGAERRQEHHHLPHRAH